MPPGDVEPSADGTVTSSDGTTLGYYQIGQGEGVVLVHGAGQTAESFRTLATDLSSRFTVSFPIAVAGAEARHMVTSKVSEPR